LPCFCLPKVSGDTAHRQALLPSRAKPRLALPDQAAPDQAQTCRTLKIILVAVPGDVLPRHAAPGRAMPCRSEPRKII